MMNCFAQEEQTKDKTLRYFTFRAKWDIEQIEDKGIFEVKENFNQSYMWDLGNFYFKEDSVIWGFAFEGNVPEDMKEYMGMNYLVEFNPDNHLIFTAARHEMIRNCMEIVLNTESFINLFNKCKDKDEIMRLEEKLIKYDLGMNDKFLKYCETEKANDGEYIIMFPHIKKEQVISITDMSVMARDVQHKDSTPQDPNNHCSFCKGKGCAVCQLDKYLDR